MVAKDDGSPSIADSSDLTLLPDINFGFVEDFVKANSQSLGSKEILKGYKYFAERYLSEFENRRRLTAFRIERSVYRHYRVMVTIFQGSFLAKEQFKA